MPYAEVRTFYDADSHLMELSSWLAEYADPDVREKIRPLYLGEGRDPLQHFDDCLAGAAESTRERFYSANYARMLGMEPARHAASG